MSTSAPRSSLASVTLMDAASVPMALLGPTGEIIEANDAWRLHVAVSTGFDARLGAGASYLGACRRAADDGDPDAGSIALGLHSVLVGNRDRYEITHPSPSSSQMRWIHARFSAVDGDERGRTAIAVLIDVTDRWQLTEALGQLEGLDPSTGLPSADVVDEHLALQLLEARRVGGRVALASIVLVGGEEIARSLGPPVADQIVVQAIGRIRRAVRSDDVVFRRGAAELVLVGRGLGANGFEALLARLRDVVREPYHLAGREIAVRTSVAGALSTPSSTVRSLLDELHRSAAEAPVLGPVRTDSAAPAAPEHRNLGGAGGEDPRPDHDLAGGTLRIAYRPVVRLQDQAIVGAELIAVIELPDGSELDLFDGATADADAERSLRRRHAETCLLAALEAAARLQRAVPEQTVTLVVGVVAEQLVDPTFVERVETAIERAGSIPSRVAVQVTEEELSRADVVAHGTLVELKRLGLQLSIADFGRGHCSLAELSRLPIDAVRADLGALAAEPGEAAAMAAVLAVAQALGFRAVATGIDAAEDVAELARLRCSYGQGARWPDVATVDILESHLLSRLGATQERDGDRARLGHVDADGLLPAPAAEELDAVFRSLVHEVRTPLTVAMGWASMMEASSDEQSVVAATSIRRATERINRMLANLEDVRMIDQGSLRLETRVLDLRRVVEDVVAEMREVMGVAVEIREDEGFPLEVSADENRVTQVLINLISNAAKFSSTDHVIEVRLWKDAGWAEVSVVDDGPGVPPEALAVIFRKYGRGSNDRPGSGLGLYLARGIALAHGGNLTYRRRWLRSGSVFTLRIPLCAEP